MDMYLQQHKRERTMVDGHVNSTLTLPMEPTWWIDWQGETNGAVSLFGPFLMPAPVESQYFLHGMQDHSLQYDVQLMLGQLLPVCEQYLAWSGCIAVHFISK